MQGSHTLLNKKFKDFQGHIFPFSRTPFSVKKEPNESMSFLVLSQHEQFYPEVVSLFARLDKVSTEIQGLSSTYFNFQGLSRTFKVHANPVHA